MPTPKELDQFEQWLLDRGRSDGTARSYRHHMKLCGESRSLTARLLEKKFAPKSRRAYMAALSSWAAYTKDSELAERIKDIKLPPAVRVTPKTPLDLDAWRRLIKAIRVAKLRPGMRQILMLMAMRGMRCGDVLRITRRDISAALMTRTLSFEAKGARRLEYEIDVIRPMLVELVEIPGWSSVRDLVGKRASADRVIGTRIRRVLSSVGLKVSIVNLYPHRLRRTYATWFLRAIGPDPQALVKLKDHMQWANIATAAEYTDDVSRSELGAVGSKLMRDLLATPDP